MSRPKKTATPPKPITALPAATHAYVLQQLYVDQDRDWVIDVIPAVLAWMPGTSNAGSAQPFSFLVDHKVGVGPTRLVKIDLAWTLADLQAQDPSVAERADRMCTGKTAQREHVTELAAYGLTFVAMSVLMPGTRIKHMRKGLAPDILFDVTPGALRGVEAAGRATGGRAALLTIRNGGPATKTTVATKGKAAQLMARSDVAEAHLSLWCAAPQVAIMEQVKP